MTRHCISCACPLEGDFTGPAEDYCKYCTDEEGNLLDRERIRKGVAGWLKNLDPDISEEVALKRADHYMLSMPAWAED